MAGFRERELRRRGGHDVEPPRPAKAGQGAPRNRYGNSSVRVAGGVHTGHNEQ